MTAQERRKSGSGFDTDFGKYLSSIEEVIEEARNGRMFILVDEEDRENEGDLVIPAQMATPEAINFMARFGRGLVCLSLPRERIEQLGLPLMGRENNTRHQTAFTVSMVRTALGDAAAAAKMYEPLSAYRGGVAMAGSLPIAGSVDLALSGLARVTGETALALEHAEAAIEVESRMGSRAWLARALEARWAATGSASHRDEALALATELGCVPVLRRLGAT